MSEPEFVIIYDTYCGWCYGAGPVFDALVERSNHVEVLHRHLFQGSMALRMADGKGAHVLEMDARISALTGQTFSRKYTEQIVLSDTEVLASRLTAHAAALVHEKGPKAEFAVRRRLERARYLDGVSASDRGAVVAALVAEGVPHEQAERVGTAELDKKADAISRKAARLMDAVGSHGVPTILRRRGRQYEPINHASFYRRPQAVADLFDEALS